MVTHAAVEPEGFGQAADEEEWEGWVAWDDVGVSSS